MKKHLKGFRSLLILALFAAFPLAETAWPVTPRIFAGLDHSVVLKTDGDLWSWGANSAGQLGDGTNIDKNSPTRIGTHTNWTFITAAGLHTMAVRTDGTFWGWGLNYQGQLGDGTTISKSSPVRIGTDTNWASQCSGILLQHGSQVGWDSVGMGR